ncbi:unnamed protein product [Closterium sp. Naga37s-1]|nr:unnamed protein product [Closterium sp. Naga37s-1]
MAPAVFVHLTILTAIVTAIITAIPTAAIRLPVTRPANRSPYSSRDVHIQDDDDDDDDSDGAEHPSQESPLPEAEESEIDSVDEEDDPGDSEQLDGAAPINRTNADPGHADDESEDGESGNSPSPPSAPSPPPVDLAEQLRLPESCILRRSLSRTDHTAAIVTLLLLPRYQPTFPRSFLAQVDSRMRRHEIHLDARLYGEYSLVALTQLLPPLAPPSLPAPSPPPVPAPPAPGNSGSSSGGGGGGGGYTTSDASGNSNVVDSASGSSSSSSSSSNSTSSQGGSSPSPGGVANYSGSSSNSLGSGTATGGVGAQAQAGGNSAGENSAGENGSEQQGMSVNMVVLLVVGAVAVTAVGVGALLYCTWMPRRTVDPSTIPRTPISPPLPLPVLTCAAEPEVLIKGKGSSSDLQHPIHPAHSDEDGDAYANCCLASSTAGFTAGAAGAYSKMGARDDGADTRAEPGDECVRAAVSAAALPAAGLGCGRGSEGNSDGGVAGGSGKGGLGGLSGVREFSLQEMALATNNFHESSVLGEGGFGRVYRGTIPPQPHSTSSSPPAAPIEVAIKRMDRGGRQGDREFLVEVEVLSRLHHRHLVKLLGYCVAPGEHMLCYELLPNGSLHSWLHGPHSHHAFLDWPARVSIAVGAARGLAYLHEGSQPAVIHRDLKPSNILLDARMSPKLADFGLAKAAPQGADEHVSTRVMGTFGYVAPEYAMTGHLMVPSDVYSFGVVLLELLSGRKAVDTSRPLGQESLVLWARPLLSKPSRYLHLLDPRLLACPSPPPPAALHTVATLANACVHSDPAARPSMSTVVELLRRAQQTSNADQKQPSFASLLSLDTLCMASPCVQEQGGSLMPPDSNPDSSLGPHSPRSLAAGAAETADEINLLPAVGAAMGMATPLLPEVGAAEAAEIAEPGRVPSRLMGLSFRLELTVTWGGDSTETQEQCWMEQ